MKRQLRNITICIVLLTMFLTACQGGIPTDNSATTKPDGIHDPNTTLPEYTELTEEDIARLDYLQNLHNEQVYNIQEFGAVPGEDATDAIQLAIDTLQENGGGIIYFPAGIYYVNQVVTFKRGQNAPITLLGEIGGELRSKISVNNPHNTDGIMVESDNISFANLEFMHKANKGAAVCLTGDKATLYNCTFRNYTYGYTDSLLRVCGTGAVMSDLGFTVANEEGHSINFTKLPGVLSQNNKLVDTHIGGEFDGIVIDSRDPEGCPENLLLSRLTFLNYSGGQLDIHAVRGCVVAGSMLDQGYYYCIKICPDGVGVEDLTITDNYISAAYKFSDETFENYGIIFTDGDGKAKVHNVNISNNMIYYNRHGIYSENDRVSNLYISGNSVGDSTYSLNMKSLKDSTIIANYFSSKFMVDVFTGENSVLSNVITKLDSGCDFDKYAKENVVAAKG